VEEVYAKVLNYFSCYGKTIAQSSTDFGPKAVQSREKCGVRFREESQYEITPIKEPFWIFKSESILPEPSLAIGLRKRKVSSLNDNFSEVQRHNVYSRYPSFRVQISKSVRTITLNSPSELRI